MKVIKYLLLILLLTFNNNLSQELVWKHLGGPYGGIIDAMAINSKGDLFAGTYTFGYISKGAYKSSDKGETWTKLATEFPEYEVYSLHVTNDEHIWIGTINARLYRSTDNGLTWENKSTGFVGECWAFGESKDGVLFAGDADRNFLFRSTNKGDNWQSIMNNVTPLSFAADSNNKIYMGTMNGLYYSTNNGQNWFRDNSFPNYYVPSIVIDSNNNVFCATGYSFTNGDGVFYSTNGGTSWSHLGLSTKAILSLAFDSKGNLYAGSKEDGIYVTNDMGNTWSQFNKGLYRKQISKLIINKNDEIFVGSEGGGDGFAVYAGGGVFRSTNNGSSFEHVGLPFSKVNNSVLYGDSLIISSTFSGVQVYNLQTEKWRNIGLHNVNAINITNSDNLYAGTDIGIYKCNLNDEKWELLEIAGDTTFIVYNFLAVNDDTLFVATNSNLRRTTNGGISWDKLNIGTGDFSRGMFYKNNILYVTGYLSGTSNLFKSTDFGNNFNMIISSINTNNILNPISVLNNGHIYLASKSSLYSGILRTTDSGNNWLTIYPSENIITTIYVNEEGVILSSNRSASVNDKDKIIISSDFGNNWSEIPQPTRRIVNVIDIIEDENNKYYFSTNGDGLYEIDIITSVKQEETIPQGFSLSQNYPNPFNPSTVVSYQLPVDSKVSLKVFDILGKEVATLVNESQSAGKYNINFNTSEYGNFSSGIYYYKLTAGDFVQTRKMILLK